jgi:hypothetical protein
VDLGDHVVGAVRQVVPGETQEGPAGPDERVSFLAVGAEALDVGVPGPPVDFDGDPGLGKRNVDLPPAEGQAELPAGDAGRAQEIDEDPFGG